MAEGSSIKTRYLGWKIFGSVFGVFVIGGIWCWWWPWLCPFCCCDDDTAECVETEPAVEILVDDIHSAVWMPMDGSWIHDPGTTSVCELADTGTDAFGECGGTYVSGDEEGNFRHGVLFQMGEIIDWSDGSTSDHFKSVVLTYADTTAEELDEDDFDWLDVLHVGEECAIDPFHAYSLFDLDSNVVGVECDGLTTDPQSCLRNRSIHASFKPNVGAMTYWAGGAGYEAYSTTDPGGAHGHVGYVFELPEAVSVDRWKNGCFQERHESVIEIRIVFTDGGMVHHGGLHDPIMDGGSITYPPE